MGLLHDPTVVAALIIAGGLVLAALISRGAIKRLARGLSEGASALSRFTATLDLHNRIASDVEGVQREQEHHSSMLGDIDALLREWGSWFRWLPRIKFADRYLTAVDGERYTEWQSDPDLRGPVTEPAEHPPGFGQEPVREQPAYSPDHAHEQSPVGPNPRYPELPFDPDNPGSIDRYLLGLVHQYAPQARLDDGLPEDFAREVVGFVRGGDTWRRWAIAQTNAHYGAVLEHYGLPLLGSDMTQTMRRIEDDRTSG